MTILGVFRWGLILLCAWSPCACQRPMQTITTGAHAPPAAVSSQPQPQPEAPLDSVAETLALNSPQSGAANVATQIAAGGWKGIEYQSQLPFGLALLLAWQSWLSHRREVLRQRGRPETMRAVADLAKSFVEAK